MIEFQEFPKMIYHPETNAPVIVRSADEEADQLDAWGTSEAPKIPLRAADDGAPRKPKAAPKTRARKPKGA